MTFWIHFLFFLVILEVRAQSTLIQVPIRLGATNIITFEANNLLTDFTNTTRQEATNNQRSGDQYVYSFSNLPSWINNVNGSTISGIPNADTSLTIISVIFAKRGEAQNKQDVVLLPSILTNEEIKKQKINGSQIIDFETAFQYNNINNPINPKSPYNPYNPLNPKGIRYSGLGYDLSYYTLDNPNNPSSTSSIFNLNNPSGIYNPLNPRSPLYLYGKNSLLNPNSSIYNKTLTISNLQQILLNPLDPNSIFYPQSPNYFKQFQFSNQLRPQNLIDNGSLISYAIRVLLQPPQPITYTPPPDNKNTISSPNYISSSIKPTSDQIQGLLAQQAEAQRNLAQSITSLNKANSVLSTLQSQVNPINNILKQTSSYLNSTNIALQRAIQQQNIGRNQSYIFTKFLNELTNKMSQAESYLNQTNSLISINQKQLILSQNNMGPYQSNITSMQISYNKSMKQLETTKSKISQCESVISNSRNQISIINKELQNNTNAVNEAKSALENINIKISQLQALMIQARNAKNLAESNLNILITFPEKAIQVVQLHNSNITTCQNNINNFQSSLPILEQNKISLQNSVNNAQKSFVELQNQIRQREKKIGQNKQNLTNIKNLINALQVVLNKAHENQTIMNNNQNILNQNVLTLQRQNSDAVEYLKKVQKAADQLKEQLSTATVTFTLAKNTYQQAKSRKDAADAAIDRIIITNQNPSNNQKTALPNNNPVISIVPINYNFPPINSTPKSTSNVVIPQNTNSQIPSYPSMNGLLTQLQNSMK